MRRKKWFALCLLGICSFGVATSGRVQGAPSRNDWDGDGRTDPTVVRGATAFLVAHSSAVPPFFVPFWTGSISSTTKDGVALTGDFGGFRRTDRAVWNPTRSTFWIGFSVGGETTIPTSDIPSSATPVIADYTGDGRDDIAFFIPLSNRFAIRNSSTGVWQWHSGPGSIPGALSVRPAAADYTGDGIADRVIAVLHMAGTSQVCTWTAGTWSYSLASSPGDIPVVGGDYDGDGRVDFALWNRNTGIWNITCSGSQRRIIVQWGLSGFIPVVGNYDGVGGDDIAVWDPVSGNWFVRTSSGTLPPGFVAYLGGCVRQWGVQTDRVPQP